jgi:MGT family glycosyltransferase
MKIVILTIPAYGHINPQLALASKLAAKGHDVTFYVHPKFVDYVSSYGFHVKAYVNFDLTGFEAKDLIIAAGGILKAAENIYPTLSHELEQEKPDLIVRDLLAFWGYIIEQKQMVRTTVTIPILVFTPLLALRFVKTFLQIIKQGFVAYKDTFLPLQTEMNKFCHEVGIKPILLPKLPMLYGRENIVFTYPNLQPGYRFMDKQRFAFMPEIFVASKIKNDFVLESKPKIYLSLGTLYNKDQELFISILEQLDLDKYQVIVSTGNMDTKLLAKKFSKAVIRQFINQSQLLPQVDLVIFSGGMNTTRECIAHKIPMLIIPLIIDQEIQADITARKGMSVKLSRDRVLSDHNLVMHTVEDILSRREAFVAKIENFLQLNDSHGVSNLRITPDLTID